MEKTACGGSGGSSGGDGHLVFMIWDSGQKSDMEAIADAYMEEHPDATIEVQASGWDEYWTKLEAAAKSNSLPDIFWMHSNQMYTYADAGILADCTDIVDEANYAETAVENAKGSDGRIYGVPKDKDTVTLLYNSFPCGKAVPGLSAVSLKPAGRRRSGRTDAENLLRLPDDRAVSHGQIQLKAGNDFDILKEKSGAGCP